MQAHNFVFFGTPSAASETLAALVAAGFIPRLVVTSPDAPVGRGLVLTPSPVKKLAVDLGLPTLTPEHLDTETISRIAEIHPEFAIVVAYGKIFPDELINSFPKGVLNVHYSLLPKYRGATPLEAALLAGEKETGVTIQKMVKELDAGDIVAARNIPIGDLDTARELRPRLIKLGAALLVETLPDFELGAITLRPQGPHAAPNSRKLKKEQGLLSLDAPAEENWNKYRAYADSIGTYFFHNGKRVKIVEASLNKGEFRILKVIPEGKREMNYADFIKNV